MQFPRNIFLADDDRDDIEFFNAALEEICNTCNITVSLNGEELIDNLRKAAILPDIIFIDVNMPRIDGLTALATIKEMPALVSVPIIVCSTSSSMLSISRAYERGANYYFVKPSSFNSLKGNIQRLLETDWNSYTVPAQIEKFIIAS